MTKHVRFAEDKSGYEWIHKGEAQEYKYNDIWSENEDSNAEDNDKMLPQEEREDESQQSEEESNVPEEAEIVGVQNTKEAKKRGRPKKKIRNPYGRKGKPENVQHSQEEEDSTEQSDIEANLIEIYEPQNIEEALASPQAERWKGAIRKELDSLVQRKTWETMRLPEGKRCIGCKWIFKLKTDAEGNIRRYKARLVAQGFTQEKGIDYNETYSPVVNFSIIRLLSALSVECKWYTRHIDVKNAYLYGNLHEEIYMKLPPLYNGEEGKVAKLLRPIYGLKQSGRNWNEELNESLIKIGFERLKSSSCTYRKGYWTVAVIYVDDIFIFSNKLNSIEETVNAIAKRYEIKDLGEIHYAIGVKVGKNQTNMAHLSQEAYINSILRKYNMQECRRASTPLEPGTNLSKEDSPVTREDKEEMSRIPYRELIGSMMHLSQYTRPDIAFATSKLSQYNSNPGKTHWTQAKHVLRYLNKTKDFGLVYRATGDRSIRVYCDEDWAGDQDDRRSYSGVVVMMGGNLIHWKSTKQTSISTSTMESEYIALSHGVKEIIWLNMFLSELKLRDYVTSFQLFSDI